MSIFFLLFFTLHMIKTLYLCTYSSPHTRWHWFAFFFIFTRQWDWNLPFFCFIFFFITRTLLMSHDKCVSETRVTPRKRKRGRHRDRDKCYIAPRFMTLLLLIFFPPLLFSSLVSFSFAFSFAQRISPSSYTRIKIGKYISIHVHESHGWIVRDEEIFRIFSSSSRTMEW